MKNLTILFGVFFALITVVCMPSYATSIKVIQGCNYGGLDKVNVWLTGIPDKKKWWKGKCFYSSSTKISFNNSHTFSKLDHECNYNLKFNVIDAHDVKLKDHKVDSATVKLYNTALKCDISIQYGQ